MNVVTLAVLRRLMRGVLVFGVVGCGEALDADDLAALPSITNYQDWTRHETQGFAPGHKESFRRIYVNREVEGRLPGSSFPVGSVIVKEIYELAGTRAQPAPGDLLYLAIMRRPAVVPTGLTLDAGWLFTNRDTAGSEKRVSTCWSTCHQQAPHEGVFLDYATVRP